MIRIGTKIKLSPREQAVFAAHTGLKTVPQDVASYNQALQDAQDYWQKLAEQSGEENTAQHKLMIQMLELEKITP